MGDLETAIRLLARHRGNLSEPGHSVGEGNRLSNAPAAGADRGRPAVDLQEGSRGSENISGAGPQPTRGHVEANAPGPPASEGVVEIRRMAAAKGLEAGRSSEGNKESNPPGRAAANEKRTGEVKAPAKAPPERNDQPVEGRPPFSGEKLAGDGWSKARAQAKDMLSKR